MENTAPFMEQHSKALELLTASAHADFNVVKQISEAVKAMTMAVAEKVK